MTSGAANYVVNGNIGTVTQDTERAILNWQSFNIDAGGTMNFVQPSASAAALNRIFQNDPSRIFGTLKANGQVYLINQNGIVFGRGAQVNTGALVASTLNVTDQVFNGLGIVGAINNDLTSPSGALPAFEGLSDARVLVEEGASLRGSDRVILVGADIENRGRIETPDGQSILAASHDKVYVASDRELGGLLVEVDTGGSVTNIGDIIAERGNVTLAGLAVNQNGRVNATTSVSAGGSVRLLARDGAQVLLENGARKPTSSRNGVLTFGENSLTEVLPELASTATAIDLQVQPLSNVEGFGETIELRRGARIVATGGNVSLRASPNAGAAADARPTVYLADGSLIDVSGDDTAQVPMERNQGRIKLFGNELADAPVQREGPLARQEIAVDLRYGTRITDISRLRDDIKRGVGERLSAGGTVTLDAQGIAGDVILQQGSTIDFSGGKVTYQDGYLETTKVVDFNGQVIDIANADPNTPYSGIYGSVRVRYERWGVIEEFSSIRAPEFHAGYIEGKDAGRLAISGTSIATGATLRGNTVVGRLQRELSNGTGGITRAIDQLPLSGLLEINRSGVLPEGTPGLSFANDFIEPSHVFGMPLEGDLPITLSSRTLAESGINRLRIATPGELSLPENVRLTFGAGADIAMTADDVNIEGDVVAPSGRVSFTARAVGLNPGSLTLAGSASIDTSGTWVNDLADINAGLGAAPLTLDGGQVTLTARGDLTLEAGSLIDVSGGAQLRANGTVAGGSGGLISLTSSIAGQPASTIFDLQGTLRGYGFNTGGRLRLAAAEFQIGDPAPPVTDGLLPPAQRVELGPDFFSAGGFSHFELIADRGSINIDPDTNISIAPQNLQLRTGAQDLATGSELDPVIQLTTLPTLLRAPSSFSATVSRSTGIDDAAAVVRIGERASISTEAGGTITLASDSDLFIGGSLTAHGGAIRATLNNPGEANERGFRADQALRLGAGADLDVSGIGRSVVDGFGNRSGDVLSGGQVVLTATRGFVIADSASNIDVSGAHQQLDLPNAESGRLQATDLPSNAGSIRVTAAEGALLFGTMGGAPGDAGAAGATLAVTLDATHRDPADRVVSNPSRLQFPMAQREIVVGGLVTGGFPEGVDVPESLQGKGLLSAERVGDGTFDVLDLTVMPLVSFGSTQSAGQIRFDGDVSLRAGRRISLDASVIASGGQDALVAAPYVSIGPSQTQFRVDASPQAGGGRLTVDADHIDFRGRTTFGGFAAGGDDPALAFNSSGDIRMIGTRFIGDGVPAGSLTALADFSFDAAQIFPSTLTDFSVRVTDPDGRILIGGGNADSVAPSAGGRLSFSAASINQAGVLRAPFGEISLDATESLTLAASSITSTSGAGMVLPFGLTEFGETWVYPLGEITRLQDGAPDKAVRLHAPEIEMAAGSLVDISGGGDLLAYEFVRGPGGSRDILLGNNPEGAFAIVPGWGGLFGAFDPLESPSAGIEVGSTIELAGNGIVPAGVYARLPARYALLPGAFLVTPSSGPRNVASFAAGVAADGVTSLVAGRTGFAGTDVHAAQWSSYTVRTGAEVRRRAEYAESLASKFFTSDGVGSSRDAGRLAIEAERSIRLEGSLAATAAGGAAAQVDFVADNLAVVHQRSDSEERVELVDSELQSLGAASLLLGGTRAQTPDGTNVAVSAERVSVESGVTLEAPEIILAARNDIRVQAGARISGHGSAAIAGEEPKFSIAGNGAFVRLSSGERATLERTNVTGQRGQVIVEEGATLSADGSLMLEASRDVISSGDLLASGGSLSLAASLVSIGAVPDGTTGLVLSNQDLSNFQAGELILSSRSTIDFHGAVDSTLNAVTFEGAGLRGMDNSAVHITARELTLGNAHGATPSAVADGEGSFAFTGETVTLERGAFDISGFATTQLTASHEIVGNSAASLNVRGDLALSTSRITVASGADAALTASGQMTTVALEPPPNLDPVSALGAGLSLTAAGIQHGARIELPSGIASLTATGPAGVSLLSGSTLVTSGRDIDFNGTNVGSRGGQVQLTATQGPIDIADGALIDVSGAPGGGDAGAVAIHAAAGQVSIASAANLRGAAQASASQGEFELAAGVLTNGFSALNGQLNAGGFDARRALSLGSGDVAIGAGELVRARDFSLVTNGGRIDVAGAIDATGQSGGSVLIAARDGVTLRDSARIDASADEMNERGGRVEIATTGGTIDTRAVIDVGGRDAAGATRDDGHLRLRAPRVGTTGVGVSTLAGNVSGAARIDIEAVANYTTTNVNAGLVGAARVDTAAFMANAAAIESSLGVAGDARVHVIPGVDISSAGDLSLGTPWDLMSWRDGGEAGVLTLRAAGNLTLNQSLSDGFASQAVDFLPERDVVQTGPSWSYRLVAGAASAGADPLGAVPGLGSVTVGNNVYVRTGTGSIDVAAGNDLVLATGSSSIYTAGANRGTGFLDPIDAEILLRADFLEGGGDVRVRVGRDVHGVSDQTLPDWLPRLAGEFSDYRAGLVFPASWAVDTSKFVQGIGALGGGNVSISAGGSLESLTVALPTNALPFALDGSDTRVAGGGDLNVDVDGDVRGGQYMLGRGHGEINAGGQITNATTGDLLAPVVQLGDADFTMNARTGVSVETVFNPTVAEQNPEQGLLDYFFFPVPAYFFTYTDRSAFSLNTIAGDAVLQAKGDELIGPSNGNRLVDPALLSLFPGSLTAHSLQGDVRIQSAIELFPQASGTIELLAGNNVTAQGAGSINLPDGDVSLLPDISRPAGGLNSQDLRQVLRGHAVTPVHAADNVPALIVAREGNVGPIGRLDSLTFDLAKQARIFAGEDVSNVTLRIQHAGADDITEIAAGNDIIYTTTRDSGGNLRANTNVISVAGSGRVNLLAGRDVDFGSSAGIETRGDLANAALADSGADINIWTGQTTAPDFAGFINRYLGANTRYATRLHEYVQGITTSGSGSDLERFRTLSVLQQRDFIQEVFFAEIKRGGLDDTTIGFDAIKTLFPQADRYQGDLKSFLSHIRTVDGGDVSLIVPGGLVNAGVASSGSFSKPPSEIGIIAQRDGDVSGFTRGNFLVNASRVFALDGGDILVWSSEGNIDAGRGARSALAIPPPLTTFDAQGNVIIEFPAAVSGSGIRAAVTTPGRKPGDVYLFAPAGVVDAGEAGIGSAGNVTIVATEVIGADNIEVGGVAVGIPVDTGGLGASLASVSSVASSASSSAVAGVGPNQNEKSPLAEAALGWLDVFILGFGEDTCKPDDLECLKKNRKAPN